MKTKKEIEDMIADCRALREVIPGRSFFGDDNHGNLDKKISALTKCLDKDEGEVEDILEAHMDAVDYDGEDPTMAAYDWVLENTDDPPADKEDIQIFRNEKRKGGQS